MAEKEKTILVVTSLLSILLLTLHVTDDIVRGISRAEPSNIALVVLVVFLLRHEPHLQRGLRWQPAAAAEFLHSIQCGRQIAQVVPI